MNIFSSFSSHFSSHGSGTTASSKHGSIENDAENPSPQSNPSDSSPLQTEDRYSPATIRAPSSNREPSDSAQCRSTIPSKLPMAARPPRPPPKKDLLDRVFDGVERTVCRVESEPEIPAVMKKKVVIEERQDSVEPGNISSSAKDDGQREEPCTTERSETPLRSILRKEGSDCEAKNTARTEHKEDFLDYFFENVEGMVCRDKRSDDDEDDNSIAAREGGTESSSASELQRLGKVARYQASIGDEEHTRKDALDYMFECGRADDMEQQLRIYPTPAEDRDILDHLFECGAADVEERDCRDASRRAPLRQEQRAFSALQNRDSNSIIDEVDSAKSEDGIRIGRVEILRNKKRQIEEQRRMLQIPETEPRYLVPRGYILASLQAQQPVSARADAAAERSKRIRRTLIIAIVLFLVGTALIFIAASFFWPVA